MQHLFLAAEDAHEAAPAQVRVVPSLPILYFGDLDTFRASPLRIVTAALNPSSAEFPVDNPYLRFPVAAGWRGIAAPHARFDVVQHALNRYFQVQPYTRWFAHFERVLHGFDASYYGDKEQCALHTDLLSPVATNPTWSKLAPVTQTLLSARGVPLWHAVLEELQPHLVLLSVASRHLATLHFPGIGMWKQQLILADKSRRPISSNRATLHTGHTVDILYTTPAQVPFGFFSHREKMMIGPKLKGRLHHW